MRAVITNTTNKSVDYIKQALCADAVIHSESNDRIKLEQVRKKLLKDYSEVIIYDYIPCSIVKRTRQSNWYASAYTGIRSPAFNFSASQ